MKLSRKRLAELQQWGVEIPTHYMGPREFGERLCKEGQPFDWEQGFLEGWSEWTFSRVQVEPEWRIENLAFGWVVLRDAEHNFHALGLPQWRTRERAEAYLKLLQEDWWDDGDSDTP